MATPYCSGHVNLPHRPRLVKLRDHVTCEPYCIVACPECSFQTRRHNGHDTAAITAAWAEWTKLTDGLTARRARGCQHHPMLYSRKEHWVDRMGHRVGCSDCGMRTMWYDTEARAWEDWSRLCCAAITQNDDPWDQLYQMLRREACAGPCGQLIPDGADIISEIRDALRMRKSLQNAGASASASPAPRFVPIPEIADAAIREVKDAAVGSIHGVATRLEEKAEELLKRMPSKHECRRVPLAVFTCGGGYDVEKQQARDAGLKVGTAYSVIAALQYRNKTDLLLEGIPGDFNSMMFDYNSIEMSPITHKMGKW